MREKKIFGAIIGIVLLALLTVPQASALDNLMALQGVIEDSGQLIDGDLVITIWNQSVGGLKIYDSGSDFDAAIVDGRFDIILGEGVSLSLNYGEYYYMDMSVNAQDMDFDGSERQIFQSNIGNITTAINSLNLGGISASAFLNNDSSLSGKITAINTTANIKRLGFNTSVELDSKFYLLSNPSNFVTNAVTNLLNYYNKTLVYNKTASDARYYSSTNPSSFISDGNTNWDNSYGFINQNRGNNTYVKVGTRCQCTSVYDRLYNFSIGANGSCTTVCGFATEATLTMTSTGVTMLNNTPILDLFNAAGSGQIVRIIEVTAFQRDSAAVTGINAPVELKRTTTAGTGGTAMSAGEFDTTDTALAAQVTARTGPAGGAAQTGNVLSGTRVTTEEASLGTGAAGSFPWLTSIATLYANDGSTPRQRLVLREGEGILCKYGNVAGTAAGRVACSITFQIGSAYSNELPTYSWQSSSLSTGTKKMIDIFNAAGSGKVLKITRINAYAKPTIAITGIVIPLEVYRTSDVGTGGSAITADKYDTNNAAVPGQITSRDGPTGGATISGGAIIATVVGTDETTFGEYGGFGATKTGSNVQYIWNGASTRRPLTVREGEGITIQTGPVSGVHLLAIVVEGTLE